MRQNLHIFVVRLFQLGDIRFNWNLWTFKAQSTIVGIGFLCSFFRFYEETQGFSYVHWLAPEYWDFQWKTWFIRISVSFSLNERHFFEDCYRSVMGFWHITHINTLWYQSKSSGWWIFEVLLFSRICFFSSISPLFYCWFFFGIWLWFQNNLLMAKIRRTGKKIRNFFPDNEIKMIKSKSHRKNHISSSL